MGDMTENIQGFDQPAPTFSGMFQAAPPVPASPEQARKLVVLDHQDFVKLDGLIRDEAEARTKFETASKRRDKFCLELEKKHDLGGLSWVVDHDRKAIAITGQRQRP